MRRQFILRHWLWVLAFVLLLAVAIYLLHRNDANSAIVLSSIGGLASAFFAIQKQRAEDLRLFRDLFGEFNRRYDDLNDELHRLGAEDQREIKLEPEDLKTLYEYFSLCGEEFLFYQRGFIYDEVWHSWLNGMRYFYACPRIGEVWKRDLDSESYYGLTAKIIEGLHTNQ